MLRFEIREQPPASRSRGTSSTMPVVLVARREQEYNKTGTGIGGGIQTRLPRSTDLPARDRTSLVIRYSHYPHLVNYHRCLSLCPGSSLTARGTGTKDHQVKHTKHVEHSRRRQNSLSSSSRTRMASWTLQRAPRRSPKRCSAIARNRQFTRRHTNISTEPAN